MKKDDLELVSKKSFNYELQGFKKISEKSGNIEVGIRSDEVSLYLGPMKSFYKHGEGIRYFKN